jgi:predicted site-specific integrase-resolvase
MKRIKLSQWAKQNNLSYVSAYNLFKQSKLPVHAIQLETGTILVEENIKEENRIEKIVLYARVSSHDQKEDLQRQIERLKSYAANQGLLIYKEYCEVGSGVNPRRRYLQEILSDPTITKIIIEHKDRLTRFGFDMLKTIFNSYDREIVVLNQTDCENDLVQDMIDILTSFCARIYGKRSAKNKVKKIIEEIQ